MTRDPRVVDLAAIRRRRAPSPHPLSVDEVATLIAVAVDEPGPCPEHHEEVKARHRAEWPTLWAALDLLLTTPPGPREETVVAVEALRAAADDAHAHRDVFAYGCPGCWLDRRAIRLAEGEDLDPACPEWMPGDEADDEEADPHG